MKLSQFSLLTQLLARRRTIIFVAAAALGTATFVSGAGEGLDNLLRSARDGLRSHSASGEVHIVEIDARSLGRIDQWPWPRSVYAKAIDRLNDAGARSVAFDVDFSSLSNPREDRMLADALDRAGQSVILPTFRQAATLGSKDYVDSVPAKPFAEKGFLAAVNVAPDADGYVRRMPLGVETFGTARPSLSTMVAERQAIVGADFEIDYSIDPASIPRHSLVDLIEGRIPAKALADKRVIIGATAIELGDRYTVPHYGVIPGVVIQALAAETLMQGPVPQRWSGFVPLVLALLLVAVALRPGSRVKRAFVFGAGAGAILALPLITESLFAISMPTAAALAALAVAGLLAGAAIGGENYRRRALADTQTGLPNLVALEVAAEGLPAYSVVVARIDRFAAMASGLGPQATATLVQRVADRLKFATFGREIYRTDDAALAWLVLPEDEPALEDRFDAIAAVMRSPVDCGRVVDVTLNMGIAAEPKGDVKQLAANASLAAFQAAQDGIRWERFTAVDTDEINWQLSLLGELDSAMSHGQVWNAYQPKLDIKSGRIIGVEALVRWLHPTRGSIAPDGFIPMVEEHGRARDLTAHVLEQALDDALHWEKLGFPIGIAVNVSATLLADHEFIELVGQTLRSSTLPTSRVTIEVTESAAMDTPERAIAALESWRALGVSISIDDYGTGQSSLGYLQKLPATELKIDKSFVQTIGTDHRNAIMVRSTIALAHELGIKVVAEGIEDAECLQVLNDMGCDTAQGYHVARPMAADQLSAFLADRAREAA